MTNTVFPCINLSIPSCTIFSVLVSITSDSEYRKLLSELKEKVRSSIHGEIFL